MTLLVGIRCADGVVIAADSGATFGSLGQSTVMQPTGRKIEVMHGKALLATSGSVGLAQRFCGELTEAVAAGKQRLRGRPDQVMVEIRTLLWKHLEPEMRAAHLAQQIVGPQAAQPSAVALCMVALVVNDTPTLFQFDQQGAPEEATEQLPFVTLGSGQGLADPFLSFLKGLFWEQGALPSLVDGTFAAIWTVRQCIDVAPAGLKDPVNVFVLAREGVTWKARELDEAEIQEHLQAVDGARQALREYRTVSPDGQAIPEPPVESA
jgi:20S proteasome alpha/beta subunit